MVCVLRTAIQKSELGCEPPLVGFTRAGEAFVIPRIKNSMLSGCSEDDLRRWNSKAADWCIDHGLPVSERLHHLVLANRDREAVWIIGSNRYSLIDSCDKDLLWTVSTLAMRRDDAEIANIAVRMALDLNDLKIAKQLSSRLMGLDAHMGRTALSEISLKENRIDEALDMARDNYGNDIDSGMALGMCLLESNRIDEASDCFAKTMESMLKEGCIFRMDELMLYKARAEMSLHNKERAQYLVSAALSLSKNERKRADLAALCEKLETDSEDSVLLQ